MDNNNNSAAFINKLLRQTGIPMETIIAFAKEHQEELQQINSIFELKNARDAQILFTLQQLLSTDKNEAEKAITYFRDEDKENYLLKDAQPDIGQYKTLLLSAFVYNQSFFLMAWNWCGYIQNQVRKQARNLDKLNDNIIEFPRQKDWRIMLMTASVSGFQSFAKRDLGDIATLEPMGDKTGDDYWFQFRLTMKDNKIKHPCALDVEFTTLKDGKTHNISIMDNRKRASVRSEPVRGIDYSGGIDIQRARLRKLRDNE